MLSVKNLNAGYGDVQVLWDLSFSIDEPKILAIVGSNGAGKTTLLRTISGVIKPKSGEIQFKGERIDGCSSHHIVQKGIIHVPEGRRLFPELTVDENLLMGAYARRKGKNLQKSLDEIYELFPRLAERKKQKAGSLSGGEQQMAAIARGLMGDPEILLIDEMSLGLAPLIVDNLVDVVSMIYERGATVMLIEQDVQLALENSHYAYIMDTGRIVKEGESKELLDDPEIKDIYLGVQ
ncbi:Phosphonate-transporting ATPase [Flexistipes sinusarabici DSM 4947]|uniref:Phosphonate-transporting ATPase n=1 Tax=Flexistipes sinusarabici (strain ATCC 49648 / DSM 4947 / MAS 10) TaxID=717231 RepID=F8E8Q8_FLESM|nr:ABC transporter ATP-binding protein [Flexistipes sinusarabici]AEI15181.1 Phosphonate-transporting ATPase [Flexistipes sinusarabici DSM 4947]